MSEKPFKIYAGNVRRLCPVLAGCVSVVKKKQLNLSVLVVDELDQTSRVSCFAFSNTRTPRVSYGVAEGDPLSLCVECSSILHAKGIFRRHKLVNISRKVIYF